MRPPSSSPFGRHKAAMVAVKKTERSMRLLTENELKTYNDAELWELYRRMMFHLPLFAENSLDYLNAQMNLILLRQMITRRAQPRPG
jgi:hypothetical protein